MDYADLKNYFEKFVRNLSFLKDEATYQSIISVLQNQYFSDSYETIPILIKTLIENKIILPDLYDPLLMHVGYPSDLVPNLRTSHKGMIVENLMDYNRYKGTLNYFQRVGSLFNESFNIYELYLDYRPIDKDEFDWVFVPRQIHKYDDAVLPVLSFDSIAAEVPTFFLTRTILEIQRQTGSIVLPIKSNLVYLDMHYMMYSSTMTDLISTTVMYAFKDVYFSMYLDDRYFHITLGNAYIVWFYILYKYADIVYSPIFKFDDPANNLILHYYFSGSSFPYSLEGDDESCISWLIEKYNSLPLTQKAVSDFRKTYIEDKFKTALATQQYTVDTFRKRAITSAGPEIIDYVDSYIEQYNDKKALATLSLLNSIYDSVHALTLTSDNTLLKKYDIYILKMFPMMLFDPKTTGTYLLLNEFKPLHTELVDKSKYYVVTKDLIKDENSETGETKVIDSYDKFNMVIPTDVDADRRYVIHTSYSSAAVLSRDYRFSISIETGFFAFDNVDFVLTDYKGAQRFNVGDYIYSRDIFTNQFPTNTAVKIISIQPTDPVLQGSFFDLTLSTWNKFSHLDSTQPAYPSELNVWTYDDNLDIVNCILKTQSFVGLVSDFSALSYIHQVRINSLDYDDGVAGVVIAYNIDLNGIQHTLSAVRTPSNNHNIPQWCIIYDYNQPTQKVIASNTNYKLENSKWQNFAIGTTIYIERNGNSIIAKCSDFQETDINHDTKIKIDISTFPELMQFEGPKPIGYCSHSQKNVRWNDINFLAGSYSFKLEKTYEGLLGVFPRAYRMWPPGIDDLIDLGTDGYYSFATSFQAREISTNEYGFSKFSVGDWIYAPVDGKDFAVQIVSKDPNTYSFRLLTDYKGTAGVWNSAYIWRPAP